RCPLSLLLPYTTLFRSTIKPFLGLAALHHESMGAHDRTMCPGFYSLPGQSRRYRDWRPGGHGSVDLHDAIVQSCDVHCYKLAVRSEGTRLNSSHVKNSY